VAADGKIGPATIAAARKADAGFIVERAINNRMAFLRGLKNWPTFGGGWSRRLDAVRAAALRMASTSDAATFREIAAERPGFLASFITVILNLFRRRK